MKVNIVFSIRAKTHILNAFVKAVLFKVYVFKTFKCCLRQIIEKIQKI